MNLEKFGVNSNSLDDIVRDVALDLASNANNGGMKEQLQYLAQAGMDEAEVLGSVLKTIDEATLEGLEVDVMEPQHADSPHNASFTGTIMAVLDDGLQVMDMENNAWDIAFDEIEKIDLSAILGGQKEEPGMAP